MTSNTANIHLPVTVPTEQDLNAAVMINPYSPYVSGYQVLIGQIDGEIDTLAQALGLTTEIVEEYTDGYQLFHNLKFPYVYPGAVGMGHGLFTRVANTEVGYSGYLCGNDGVGQDDGLGGLNDSYECRSKFFEGEIDDTMQAPDFWTLGEYEYNIDNIFKWQCETTVSPDVAITHYVEAKCWLYLPIESFVYPLKTERWSSYQADIQQYGYVKGIEKDDRHYNYWYNAGSVKFSGASALAATAIAAVAASLAF